LDCRENIVRGQARAAARRLRRMRHRRTPETLMERIEKAFEIDVPVRAAYDQWTQFEQFPRFMEGVREVRQIDDTHLHWRASVGDKEKEWDAEIVEQVPDEIIAWRSTSGAPNAGRVRFEPLSPDRTRLHLRMEYEPETAVEKAADALGVLSRKVDKTIEDFRQFIERRGRETGAWRGEVHRGQTQPPAASGLTGSGRPSPDTRDAAQSEAQRAKDIATTPDFPRDE
jgi:uncharacterized membrane protein